MENPKRRKKDLALVSRRTFNRRLQERMLNIKSDDENTCSQIMSINPLPQNSFRVDNQNVSETSNINFYSDGVSANPLPEDQENVAENNFNFLNDYFVEINSEPGSEHQSDSDSSFKDDHDTFKRKLAIWAKESNVTLIAVNKLLAILRDHGHPFLPKVGQTLLHTPKQHEILEVDPGYYVHIGIEKNILKLLKNKNDLVGNLIEIDFNIDGVPITNSTKKQLWPILGRCVSLSTKPFPVGIYYGLKKPTSSSEFLKKFVEEMEKIKETGILFSGTMYIIKIKSFICDAPAQSFVKCIIGHNGYYGCGKCTQHGEWDGRVYFPEMNFVKRTDLSFKNREDEDHHNGSCILEKLDIGMVTQFPADYLHLLCLGTMKKLLLFWIKGPLLNRLPAFKQESISLSLLNARNTQPTEFQRRIRGLDEISFFKGTEFRTTLFYTGPVVLKNILSVAQYKNFLALHIACTICNNKNFHQFLHISRQCFVYFVESFSDIYGEQFISYNIHNLLHVVDDCERYGTLEDFSAYPFESLLGKIKKKVRQGNKILQQVVNRISEGWDLEIENKKTQPDQILRKKNFSDGLITHYLYFKNKYILLQKDNKNCYFMTKSLDVYKFEFVRKNGNIITICGRKFLEKGNLYDSPLESRLLGIFDLKEQSLSDDIEYHALNDIKCKAFIINQENIMASFPMHDISWL